MMHGLANFKFTRDIHAPDEIRTPQSQKARAGSAYNNLPDHKFHERASDYSDCVIT